MISVALQALIRDVDQLEGMLSNIPFWAGAGAIDTVKSQLAERKAKLAELKSEVLLVVLIFTVIT